MTQLSVAAAIIAIQAFNLLCFGFYIAGRFTKYFSREKHIRHAKALGRQEKEIVTLVLSSRGRKWPTSGSVYALPQNA